MHLWIFAKLPAMATSTSFLLLVTVFSLCPASSFELQVGNHAYCCLQSPLLPFLFSALSLLNFQISSSLDFQTSFFSKKKPPYSALAKIILKAKAWRPVASLSNPAESCLLQDLLHQSFSSPMLIITWGCLSLEQRNAETKLVSAFCSRNRKDELWPALIGWSKLYYYFF